MKPIALSLLVLLALSCSLSAQPCKRTWLDTSTIWGGNETIVIDMRDHPVGNVRGKVQLAYGEPLAHALVQIYKRAHTDPLYRPSDDDPPLPIAACITSARGEFRFNLPDGEYELRASLSKGMDVTHVYLTVRHGLYWPRRLVVRISPGT